MYKNYQFSRKKIGGWVNVSLFFPLITASVDDLEEQLEEVVPHHKRLQKNLPNLYRGIWTTTENARTFARKHGIYDLVEPIVAFDRIALVNYMGVKFYEYFACPTVDDAIRILRDATTNVGRINMDQVFVAYKRLKGPNAHSELVRSFYTYHKDILEKRDPTLCGGHWVNRLDVKKFAKKHGFYVLLRPILDFDGLDPSQSEPYVIDLVQKDLFHYWKPTMCDGTFYEYPESFKGGLAPRKPSGGKKSFSYLDLTFEKRLVIESTKGGQTFKRNITLLRRKSDGAINATTLVTVCVLVKLNELSLGDEDPDMLIYNELYKRDQLFQYDFEHVTIHGSKYLCGKWCSIKDGRSIFAGFSLKKDSDLAKKISDFLYMPELQRVEADEDDDETLAKPEITELEMIPESDFRKSRNDSREAIYYDRKFFEDETSSDEEAIEFADFNDTFNDEKDESEDHGNDDEDSDFIPPKRNKRNHAVLDSSDLEEEPIDPRKRRKSKMFVPTDDESESDADKALEEEDEGYSAEEEGEVEDTQNGSSITAELFGSPEEKEKAPDIDERLEELERAESRENVISSLKKLVKDISEALRKDQRSKKVQREFKGLFDDLVKYRAIDQEIKLITRLSGILKEIKSIANSYARSVEDLEKNWVSQIADGELPSRDKIKRVSVIDEYGKLKPKKFSPQQQQSAPVPPAPVSNNPFSARHSRAVSPLGQPPPQPPQPQFNYGYQRSGPQPFFNNNNNNNNNHQAPSRGYNPPQPPSQPQQPRYGGAQRGYPQSQPLPPPQPTMRPSPTMRHQQLNVSSGNMYVPPQPQPQPRTTPGSGGSSPNIHPPTQPRGSPQMIIQPRAKTPNDFNEKKQNKYRERRSNDVSESYVPSRRPPVVAIPPSSSSASPLRQPKRSKEVEKRELSPPSNYLQSQGEPKDVVDLTIDDYDELIQEKDKEVKDLDPLEKYRKLTHFETRTKQDLFKRAKIFWAKDPKVSFGRRLHEMMYEQYKRKQKS